VKFVKVIAAMGALLPALAMAKTGVGRIQIDAGSARMRTIESAELGRMISIWNGPGTSSNRTSALSLADWSRGIVAPPAGLPSARITFFCGDERRPLAPCHVVKYAYDPQARRGYIYLPGPAEEGYELNVRHVFRAVEGHWFGATPQWDALMQRPTVPRPPGN